MGTSYTQKLCCSSQLPHMSSGMEFVGGGNWVDMASEGLSTDICVYGERVGSVLCCAVPQARAEESCNLY